MRRDGITRCGRILAGLGLIAIFLGPLVWGTQSTAIIHTLAGGNVGDGRLASQAPSNHPVDVVVDDQGDVYLLEDFYERVRRIDAQTGRITTVAGNGVSGYSGDGGPATEASLNSPQGIALDAAGNLYIADFLNHRIRRVDAQTGIITTVAGDGFTDRDGEGRFRGDGGPATEASLNRPIAVAVGPEGDLYISDAGNNRIRKVDMATGIITTIAGNGKLQANPARDDGGPAVEASLNPAGLAFDAQGHLYVADLKNHLIRRIDLGTGIITTVAGDGFKVVFDANNPESIRYVGNGRLNVESGPARRVSLNFPQDVAVDRQGNVYIADRENHRIRRLTPDGQLSTIAGSSPVDAVTGAGDGGFSGDGGPATMAELNGPRGVAVDASGNIFIADSRNDVLRLVDAEGIITTRAGGAISFGDGGPATSAAVYAPGAVAFDAAGNVFIAEPVTGLVRRVDAQTGIITTVAGNGTLESTGDGGPATEAGLAQPSGLAVDAMGNLYISEFQGQRVRKVDLHTGIITTIAGNGTLGFSGDGGPATEAQLSLPGGLAIDADGHLLIADSGNHRIRRVDRETGIITTIAGNGFTAGNPDDPCDGAFAGDGGPATEASLCFPTDVAVDSQGNIIILDTGNLRVRVIEADTGKITTVAGGGRQEARENGPARNARFRLPTAIDADDQGNIYIADQLLNRIRQITPRGRIVTVAGSGRRGFSGDGGPATDAALRGPSGLAVAPDGRFVFSDLLNHRVRVVR